MRAFEVVCAVVTVLGGLSLMFIHFWTGIGVLDIAVVALAVALICEPKPLSRMWSVPLVLGAGWINYVVLHPAPMTVVATRQEDTSSLPRGVGLRNDVSYLRVSLVNDSGDDFSNIDLVLRPDVPIVSIGIVNAPSACSLHGDATKELVMIGTVRVELPTLKQGDTPIPLKQISTPEYRLICSQMVKLSSVEIIAEVATFDKKASRGIESGFHAMGAHKEDFGHIWLSPIGQPNSFVVYDKTSPRLVSVNGEYVAHFKPMAEHAQASVTQQ
jgi:hypothetical protein